MVEDLQTAEFKEAFDEFDVVRSGRSAVRIGFPGIAT